MCTILVDPPRAGLDEETVQLLRRFDRCAADRIGGLALSCVLSAAPDGG